MAFGEITVVKEFTPDQADQRVGWSSVVEVQREDALPYTVVNIVAATVGADGAKLGYHEIERNGDISQGVSVDCAEGFLAVSGLEAIITREHGLEQSSTSYSNEKKDTQTGTIFTLLSGAGSNRHIPVDEHREWGTNPKEILDGLKNGLEIADAIHHYPAIYYMFNSYMAHEINLPDDQVAPEVIKGNVLADPAQHDQTKEQVDTAEAIVKNLQANMDEDTLMMRRLKVYSGHFAIDDIPGVFTESRRKVADREVGAQLMAVQLAAPRFVYLPLGFRPSGRSWPYMDALAPTEDTAFGMELRSLVSGESNRASFELDREYAELERRIIYAEQGRMALKLLAQAEIS